ncbi:MAG: RDD family protein [Sandaracinaceae bacterium]
MIDDADAPLASPQRRLAAVMLDGALGVVPLTLVAGLSRALRSSPLMLYGLLAVLVLTLIVGGVNLWLLARHGQSIGKRLLGLRIVRTDGARATLARLLFARIVVPGALGAIPFVGPLFALVDGALVFSDERKTLHDRIADTLVIDVRDTPPSPF